MGGAGGGWGGGWIFVTSDNIGDKNQQMLTISFPEDGRVRVGSRGHFFPVAVQSSPNSPKTDTFFVIFSVGARYVVCALKIVSRFVRSFNSLSLLLALLLARVSWKRPLKRVKHDGRVSMTLCAKQTLLGSPNATCGPCTVQV